ncbi:MAG TPA: secreted hydrolase [Candidatus Binatia bacterium]
MTTPFYHATASDRPWKRYPYVIPGADETWFTFPAAEGDQGTAVNTWFIETELRGLRSGRRLALLAIFAASRVPVAFTTVRADFYVFSLFNLDDGSYGTTTEFDFPRPLRFRRTHRMRMARGVLDLSFDTREGRARWTTRRDAAGAPVPFSYALDLRGRDQQGQRMSAVLDVEVAKPPAPVGGDELRGVKTCCMQLGTFSYFQTGLAVRGRVRWGDFEDEVQGDVGWIDRQFAREHFGRYTDRLNSRHRHEWRVLHLDNGWDLSVWQQFDAERGDRLVPYSGVTAQGPDGEVRATTDFRIERLSFVRDPRLVLPRKPLAPGTAFLTDRFHLTVREWDLSVTAEPYVATPAHGMPIEYWNGPVRLIGQMGGRPVSGFGFHERTKLWFRPHELVHVLRETLHHVPATGHAGVSPRALANRVWQCDVLLARKDLEGTRAYLEREVAPALGLLGAPARDTAFEVYEALLESLRR